MDYLYLLLINQIPKLRYFFKFKGLIRKTNPQEKMIPCKSFNNHVLIDKIMPVSKTIAE